MLPGVKNRPVITGRSIPEAIAAILVALWLSGLASSDILGGYVHVLLAIAVAVVMVRVIQEEALEPPDLLLTEDPIRPVPRVTEGVHGSVREGK
jgi:hypothetical protein